MPLTSDNSYLSCPLLELNNLSIHQIFFFFFTQNYQRSLYLRCGGRQKCCKEDAVEHPKRILPVVAKRMGTALNDREREREKEREITSCLNF